jgi:hypothetical protein
MSVLEGCILPDHRLFSVPGFTPRPLLLSFLIALMLTATPAGVAFQGAGEQPVIIAPQAPTKTSSIQLPAALPGDWRATGATRMLTATQLPVNPDSDLSREFGLEQLQTRSYANGRRKLKIEVFEMRYPSGAYGLLTIDRVANSPHRREFQRGRYLVRMSVGETGDSLDDQTASGVESLFATVEQGDLSPLPGHLPEQDRVPASEKYLLGPVGLSRLQYLNEWREKVDFSGGTEVAAADYKNGGGQMSLVLIEFHTPQGATAGYEAMNSVLAGLAPDQQAGRILKRTGNYIVAAVNITDKAAAQAIVDQIKYTAVVYWEGRKFTSIPLEFRPPDPAAIEEATEIAKVLLRAFYGIGTLLVGAIIAGIFSGWAVFYWRRYRRRKMGLDDAFSDAGETIRLNLDGYALQSGEPQIKLLGKGDS